MALSKQLIDEMRVQLAKRLDERRTRAMDVITASEILSYFVGNSNQLSYTNAAMRQVVVEAIYATLIEKRASMPKVLAIRLGISTSHIYNGFITVLHTDNKSRNIAIRG